jgi:endonuclease YncB( thermonuclease family)
MRIFEPGRRSTGCQQGDSPPAMTRNQQDRTSVEGFSPRAARISIMLFAACAATIATAGTRAETGRVRYVTDGDTFRLESGERIRIANIDAPETHEGQAKCRAEIALGLAASKRARALLDHRTVTFERVGQSYNRTVARVTFNGRDLGETLVAMGVARPWPHHKPKPDWCGGNGRTARRR